MKYFSKNIASYRSVLHHRFDVFALQNPTDLSEFVVDTYCEHLLKHLKGKICIVPEYGVTKRGGKPFKKLVTLSFTGDHLTLEEWLSLNVPTKHILLSGHFKLGLEIEVQSQVASALMQSPNREEAIELVEGYQYIRGINEKSQSWEGILVLKFGFPLGFFESKLDRRWNRVLTPAD